MENKDYCESKLRDVIEPLFLNIVQSNPKEIVNYSIDWLMKKGGYTANGLTYDERHELLSLRKEIKKLREMESEHKKLNQNHTNVLEDTDEEDEEEEEEHSDWDVDPHRRSLIRGPRIAVSAEAYGEYNQKGDYKPVVFPKTEDQVTQIKTRIINSFLFNSLETKELKIIIDAMELKTFKKGEVIINQGDHGDCLYIVDQGDLECFKSFSSGEEKMVKKYSEGEAFGELALLYNCPRAAKVIAFNDVTLWKLDRETFNVIVKEAAVYAYFFNFFLARRDRSTKISLNASKSFPPSTLMKSLKSQMLLKLLPSARANISSEKAKWETSST
jgi:cAMP-dependent protein kinase regulator